MGIADGRRTCVFRVRACCRLRRHAGGRWRWRTGWSGPRRAAGISGLVMPLGWRARNAATGRPWCMCGKQGGGQCRRHLQTVTGEVHTACITNLAAPRATAGGQRAVANRRPGLLGRSAPTSTLQAPSSVCTTASCTPRPPSPPPLPAAPTHHRRHVASPRPLRRPGKPPVPVRQPAPPCTRAPRQLRQRPIAAVANHDRHGRSPES
jgi:hypothetical protein